MTPERWQEVKKVLAAALERKPGERAAYLDEACADPSLRREVDSLIAAHEQADSSFLERPGVERGDLKSSTMLGPYQILGLLGAGGMGEVYRARDTRLERDVAVKVLPPGLLADEAARRRFRKESLALAKLSHPNITAVYDVGEQAGVDYLVMECVQGQTLAEKLTAAALPEKEVLNLGTQIAAALEEAHEHGVVHRDLKPGNILVTPKGQAKVLDFGLAKLLRPEPAIATTDQLSSTAAVAGTLPYMAPEQLRGKPADARSDIYAAGAVLYEMATGKRPFRGEVATALVDDILHKPPPPPGRLKHDLSPRLEEIILKCLEKDPDNRYQSAKELSVDLRRLAMPSSVTTAPAMQARPAWGKVAVRAAYVAAGLLVLVAVLVGINTGGWRDRLLGRAGPRRIESLAVLPLENLSRDPEQDYFADGMTEALITDLGKISALRVISRTSVMQFKGKRMPLAEIARELQVDAVVEGTVARAGDRVRVTANLVQASPEKHLWAETYERDLRDVLALQGDLATMIAHEVQAKLTPQERAHFSASRTVNPEAYQLYLRGRHFFEKRTEQDLRKAIEEYEQALQIDPNFALAYSGIAECYIPLGRLGMIPPQEAFPRAEDAAQKALALDDALSEAHTALGAVRLNEHDWVGTEREFKRAIELNPNYTTAHLWYGFYLEAMGRQTENLAERRRAVKADPLNLTANTGVGTALFYLGQFDQAIEQQRKTLELDPNFGMAHANLGRVYEEKRRYAEALAEYQKAGATSEAGHVYAITGRRAEAQRILAQLDERSKHHFVSPVGSALILTGLGEKERAIAWLEKVDEKYVAPLDHINIDTRFDSLRSEPRYRDLLRRIGFPP